MQYTELLGLKMPGMGDWADIGDLSEDFGLIDEAFQKKQNIVLTATGWSGSAPYTQTVLVEGMKAQSTPIPLLDTSESTSLLNEKAMKKQFSRITYYDTAEGQITFTAKYEKPNINLTVMLKGV